MATGSISILVMNANPGQGIITTTATIVSPNAAAASGNVLPPLDPRTLHQPFTLHPNYALRPGLTAAVTRVIYSNDPVLKRRLRAVLRNTFLTRFLLQVLGTALAVAVLQWLLQDMSQYIFWVTILFLVLSFMQIMRLSRHLYFLDHAAELVPVDVEQGDPAPPPNYQLASSVPPAYGNPKPCMEELNRHYRISILGPPPSFTPATAAPSNPSPSAL